jgi:hypothetical protein
VNSKYSARQEEISIKIRIAKNPEKKKRKKLPLVYPDSYL